MSIVMASVPRQDLAPLAPALYERCGLGTALDALLRVDRAQRSGGRRLQQVDRLPLPSPLPGAHAECPAPAEASFLADLATQVGRRFDVARSRVFFNGRAAGILALPAEGLALLQSRAAGQVLVGGVDTHVDYALLAALAGEGRLRAKGVPRGLHPRRGRGLPAAHQPRRRAEERTRGNRARDGRRARARARPPGQPRAPPL